MRTPILKNPGGCIRTDSAAPVFRLLLIVSAGGIEKVTLFRKKFRRSSDFSFCSQTYPKKAIQYEYKTQDFEKLYREYFARVYSFLLKLSRNESVSEELTQETFFQAYLSIHRFKGESDVFTWLASIAKHVYFKYMKKQKMSVEDSYVGLMTCAYLENSDPESELDRRELVRAVRRVVAGMPEKHRNVVLLRAYAGMSYAEIARSLKISENSAKVIYFRARKKSTEELENEYAM